MRVAILADFYFIVFFSLANAAKYITFCCNQLNVLKHLNKAANMANGMAFVIRIPKRYLKLNVGTVQDHIFIYDCYASTISIIYISHVKVKRKEVITSGIDNYAY